MQWKAKCGLFQRGSQNPPRLLWCASDRAILIASIKVCQQSAFFYTSASSCTFAGISGQIAGNVWHIKNQYYEALIRLHECKDMKDAIGCPVLAVIAEDFQKVDA